MTELHSIFGQNDQVVKRPSVPDLALQVFQRISCISGIENMCIAGGFLRGLYMQQFQEVSPEMNDIDIFMDISPEQFALIREGLEKEFGKPVRFHLGKFEAEENSRGLIEFALPQDMRKICAGVKSIQLNFGMSHPWAKACDYVELANVGINQIAMNLNGEFFMSGDFRKDMSGKTMTMNSRRCWSQNDWDRTVKSMHRMIKERPEFKNWELILTPKPHQPIVGDFWDAQRRLNVPYVRP